MYEESREGFLKQMSYNVRRHLLEDNIINYFDTDLTLFISIILLPLSFGPRVLKFFSWASRHIYLLVVCSDF